MKQIPLSVEKREEVGKGLIKRLRKDDVIPGVVYNSEKPTVSIKMAKKKLATALKTSAGENVILNLTIEGEKGKSRTVIIKEVQQHPIKGDILHIDFKEISLTQVMEFEVQIVEKGEAVGVKVDEGVLQHVMRAVTVECLPTGIPESFEIDISEMKIGDAIHAKDLTLPKGVKILTDPEAVLLIVEPPMKEVEPEAAAEEAAAEPEVITEKKPAEGEEVAAPAEEAPPKEEKETK